MSLLLDALKKAAEEKQKNKQPQVIAEEDNKENKPEPELESLSEKEAKAFLVETIEAKSVDISDPNFFDPPLIHQGEQIETGENDTSNRTEDNKILNATSSTDIDFNLSEELMTNEDYSEEALDINSDVVDFNLLSEDLLGFTSGDGTQHSSKESDLNDTQENITTSTNQQNWDEEAKEPTTSTQAFKEKFKRWDKDDTKKAKKLFTSKDHIEQSKNNKTKILALALVVVLVLGVGGYFYIIQGLNDTSTLAGTPSFKPRNNQKPQTQNLSTPKETKKTVEKPTISNPKEIKKGISVAEQEVIILQKVSKKIAQQKPIKIHSKTLPIKKLTFIQTSNEFSTHQKLSEAYQKYNNRDYQGAKRLYNKILANNPKNKDALLGVAAISLNTGDKNSAIQTYEKLTTLYPEDINIKTNLNGLIDHTKGNNLGQFTNLNSLLEKTPNSPELHFNMGNVLSAKNRWADAQKHYFRAHNLQPNNADYLYNLAISLDYLSQHKVAINYYKQALKMAEENGANFEEKSVITRISALKEALIPMPSAVKGN